MKKFKSVLFLGILIFLCSCGKTYVGKVEQAYHDGTPKLVSYYSTDEPDVLVRQKMYYPNKQLRIDGFFKDGEKDGKWTYYYEDGVLWSKGYFKMGKIDGKNESYHRNGKLNIRGSFDEGVRVGKWYYYKEDGNLEKEVNYDE